MSTLRPITALDVLRLQGTQPNGVPETAPAVMLINPALLLIDDAYQRALAKKSMALIRRIVSGWDWTKFKPPIVSLSEHGYEVIDGQHTAIAAATHPDIGEIPVLVVRTRDQGQRAAAFLGHNRDRLQMTPMQMFFSSITAGDNTALCIKALCDRHGVTILKNPPPSGVYPPRSTIAIGAITRLCRSRSEPEANRVMGLLAGTDACPITQGHIKAVDALLFDPEFRDKGVFDHVLAKYIRESGAKALRDAQIYATTHSIPQWRALTIVYYRGARPRRQAA